MKTFDTDIVSSIALDKFLNEGWNCAESTIYSILSQTDLNEDAINKYVSSVSGFNGGIGGSKHICGAISGGVAAISALIGRFGIIKSNNTECSMLTKQLMQDFYNHYNSHECLALTKGFENFSTTERRVHCSLIVEYAAEQTAKILNEYLGKDA